MGEDIADRLQELVYQGFSLNGFRHRRRRLARALNIRFTAACRRRHISGGNAAPYTTTDKQFKSRHQQDT